MAIEVDEDAFDFGARLQKTRNLSGLTQEQLAKKLGISKDTELVLYMFCERMKINFDIKEIRKHGLELFFSILFLVIAALDFHPDMRQCRSRAKTRTTQVSRTRRTKTDSDYELYS